MPKLNTDLPSCLLIKTAVNAIASATIDGRGVARELCVTFAGVRCSQFMKPLQPFFLK
jgi:hypothetical protein